MHASPIYCSNQRNIANRHKRTAWIKLSITLRWLPGGSYLDIALAHNLTTYTLYNYIDETMEKLSEKLIIEFPHRSESWLRHVSQSFSRSEISPLMKCCGALDVLAVQICELTASEVANFSTYHDRKGGLLSKCKECVTHTIDLRSFLV